MATKNGSNQSRRGAKPERGISVKITPLVYSLLRELAEKNMRSISGQLGMLVLEARGKRG